jgi:hypothetical protein
VLYFSRVSDNFSLDPRRAIFPLHGVFTPSGRVAQLAEHSALNRQVEGSIPSASTIYQQLSERLPDSQTPQILTRLADES